MSKQQIYKPLMPFSEFVLRMLGCLLFGILAIVIALGIGMWGYSHFENMNLADAYLNATMILSGMGPADKLQTVGGKIFAGSYALFSGLAFILIIGVILAPILHRLFHHYHLEIQSTGDEN